MKTEIHLMPRELLYIAAMLEAVEFMGVSDAFFGMDEQEIHRELLRLQASLEKKGYAQTDFNGNFTLNASVQQVVDICANCDIFIAVDKNKVSEDQSRELYYAKKGVIIQLKQDSNGSILVPIEDTDSLTKNILRDMTWQVSEPLRHEKIRLSNKKLSEAKEQLLSFDAAGGLKTLVDNGCTELAAKAISDGLSNKSRYYSIVVRAFAGECSGVYSAMFIDTAMGIYSLTPSGNADDESVVFETLTSEQAVCAIANLVAKTVSQRSEGSK